jgi:cold shock protein
VSAAELTRRILDKHLKRQVKNNRNNWLLVSEVAPQQEKTRPMKTIKQQPKQLVPNHDAAAKKRKFHALFLKALGGLSQKWIRGVNMQGIVRWYSAKGFGFIDPLRSTSDKGLYFHINDVKGRKVLKPGDAVTFTVVEGPKGPKCVNVQSVIKEVNPNVIPVQQ